MPNQELLDYVNQQRKSGISESDLRQRLIESGWLEAEVDMAMKKPEETKDSIPGGNSALWAYIKQQRESGENDNILRKRLVESGWPEEEINLVLVKPEENKIHPPGGNSSIYDANTPSVYELGVSSVQPIKSHDIVSEGPVVTANINKEQKKPWEIFVVLGLVMLVLIGGIIWYINQNKAIISPETLSPTSGINKIVSGTPPVSPEKLINGIFSSQTTRFSIKPPEGWIVNDSGTFGTSVVFTNPNLDTEQDSKFTANMNIVIEETTQQLADYVQTSKNLLSQNFENHVLVSEREAIGMTEPGVILESTFDQGVFKLHNLQMVRIIDNKAYVVTAVSLDSAWENYRQIFESSLASFQLI